MKTVQELCKPRENILKDHEQSYALNLSDFSRGAIDPKVFFEENFITEGMNQLLHIGFERFEKKSETALVKLTQAMGGGKTHNMILLGLLAKYPEFRKNVKLNGQNISYNKPVRVISFSGRESDTAFGIWGELAKQLGKIEEFTEYFNPILKAPGETAWIRLLSSDEPLLILLDELPPYYQNAKGTPVGNTDLSVITTTALANLFSAITKKELANVLVVIADLKATYEEGSAQLSESLRNLDHESSRIAIDLAPVKLNSDEVFSILRKKLFKEIGKDVEIREIATAYANEIRKAKQMELTIASPEDFQKHVLITYPFHPSIKDLYARFRENANFQQTRGLIRLMRTLVLSVYSERRMNDRICLLSPQHFDFNDSSTFNLLTQVNSTLNNAISKDIGANGSAISEELDKNKTNTLHQDAAKVVYFSSLALVPHAIKGLTESDIVHYVISPGLEITEVRQHILPMLRSNCWYMHLDRDGKYLFKETQNIVAKLNSLTSNYDADTPRIEIEKQLKEIFRPQQKDVYQTVLIFKHWTDVELVHDQVILLVKEPFQNGNLPPEAIDFYNNQTYKNRILVLSGDKTGMESLRASAKNIKAIEHIIAELQQEKIPESDLQFKDAISLKDTYYQNFYSACRETFNKIYFPTKDRIYDADISMNFMQNKYIAEEQIRKTLESKQKFTVDVDTDAFRLKCEQRLFTVQEMDWTEIKKRAGMQPAWQWHKPEALDRLKEKMLRQVYWKENGKYINKGPHPKPHTDVAITEISIDENTGVAYLNLHPQNGDQIFYDYHSDPTIHSMKVFDKGRFETTELVVRFLCVDSTQTHPMGNVRIWKNKIRLKYDVVNQNGQSIIHFKAIPKGNIKFTTDGSDPKEYGGNYVDSVVISRNCRVLVIAEKDGISSDILSFDVEPGRRTGLQIQKGVPLTWNKRQNLDSTNQVYEFLYKLRVYGAKLYRVRVVIRSSQNTELYIDSQISEGIEWSCDELITLIDYHRGLIKLEETDVTVKIDKVKFPKGENFEEFVQRENLEYNAGEVVQ